MCRSAEFCTRDPVAQGVGLGPVQAQFFDRDAVEVPLPRIFLHGNADVAKAYGIKTIFRRRRDILVAHQNLRQVIHVGRFRSGFTAQGLAQSFHRNTKACGPLRVLHARNGTVPRFPSRRIPCKLDIQPELGTQCGRIPAFYIKRHANVHHPKSILEERAFHDGPAVLDGFVLAVRLVQSDRLDIGHGHGRVIIPGDCYPEHAERHAITVFIASQFRIKGIAFSGLSLIIEAAVNARVHDLFVLDKPCLGIFDNRRSQGGYRTKKADYKRSC